MNITSISVGYGKMSGSVSASNSNIDSSFNSVGEQSGIKAGDGGFQVNVAGNTSLNGNVIAGTQAAVDNHKNSFTTGGALTNTDIQNVASYEGKAVGVSFGAGPVQEKLSMNGLGIGIGSGKGNASSTTTSGISGIAGNTAVRTGDAETGIQKIFDADKVQREINAQMQITQYFGQQATRAVGDYASKQLADAIDLKARADAADKAGEKAKADELRAQAQTLENDWGDSGAKRLILHTLIGGLTGGVGGAAGAAAGTLTAPAVADALRQAGIDGLLASTLTALASTAAGALAGGTAGAAAGFNEVANNFLKHEQASAMKADVAKCQSKPGGCTDSETKALTDKYLKLSNQNIAIVQNCISAGDVQCVQNQLGQAASAGEISGALPSGWNNVESVLIGRQNNVNNYGSVKGQYSLFGTDVQQAQEVATFRSDNCSALSQGACDDMVQALDDRMGRVGILMAAGAACFGASGQQQWFQVCH